MIRRRNFITIVVIAVIATALATVAGVFAVQNVIGTKTVTASVTIQSLAESLKVCGTADSSCVGSVFTGDLGFGTMRVPARPRKYPSSSRTPSPQAVPISSSTPA